MIKVEKTLPKSAPTKKKYFEGVDLNTGLISQVYKASRSNKRSPIADTKTRGEVSGGGKKPWKQKGTGRARQGSTRSPQWIGGGITFGPSKEKNYRKGINKKIKKLTISQILATFEKNSQLIIVNEIPMFDQTKKAVLWLGGLPFKNGRVTLISDKNAVDLKAFANIGYLNIQYIKGIQTDTLIESDWIIAPEKLLLGYKK